MCESDSRLRGEVAAPLARRVRGSLRVNHASVCAETAPHPDPLPAKGGAREKRALRRVSLNISTYPNRNTGRSTR